MTPSPVLRLFDEPIEGSARIDRQDHLFSMRRRCKGVHRGQLLLQSESKGMDT